LNVVPSLTKWSFNMNLMGAFLSYVELQRDAEECKSTRGSESDITIMAFIKANEAKREVIKLIEAVDHD